MNPFHESRIYGEHDHRAEPPDTPPGWDNEEKPEHDPYWNECYDGEDE